MPSKKKAEKVTVDILTTKEYIELIYTTEGGVLHTDFEDYDSVEIKYAKLKKAVYTLVIAEHSKTPKEIYLGNTPTTGINFYTKLLNYNIEPKCEEINTFLKK